MPTFPIKSEFWGDREYLLIPQFFRIVPQTLFSGGELLLDAAHLAQGFSLRGGFRAPDWAADEAFPQADAETGANPPDGADLRRFREHFRRLSPEERRAAAGGLLLAHLRHWGHDHEGLAGSVERLTLGMDETHHAALARAPLAFALRVGGEIEALLAEHRRRRFQEGLASGEIVCRPFYQAPERVETATICLLPGGLHEAEPAPSGRTRALIARLLRLPNLRWWHVNGPEGFRLNGPVDHFPELVVATQSGTFALVDWADGAPARLAELVAELGAAWQEATGGRHRACRLAPEEGADGMPAAEFLDLMRSL